MRPKIQAFVCLVLDKRLTNTSFHLHPGHTVEITWKKKPRNGFACLWRTPVYGEADDANVISVGVSAITTL